MNSEPRYMLVEEVVRELRFDATAPKCAIVACRQWLARQAVPVVKRGKRVLVDRRALAAALERCGA